MKMNVGKADRIIRFIVAIVLIDLAANKTLVGYWNPIVWIIAAGRSKFSLLNRSNF